jgi:hypothetical protein
MKWINGENLVPFLGAHRSNDVWGGFIIAEFEIPLLKMFV